MAKDNEDRLTLADRAARRKQMANLVLAGRSYKRVALYYGVSVSAVRQACRQPRTQAAQAEPGDLRKRPPGRTLDVVADLIRGGQTQNDIAEKRNVSRQRVSQIKQKAEEAGIFEAIKAIMAQRGP